MTRIQATERVAYGVQCDGCGGVIPTRNAQSEPPGYYVPKLVRVTNARNRYSNAEELFFCSKDCLVEAVTWKISNLTRPS